MFGASCAVKWNSIYLIAAFGKVAVQAIVGNVEGAVREPLDINMMVVERRLLDGSERLDPVETLCLFAPEAIRVDDGLLVHRLVGRLVSQRIGSDFRAYGIQGSGTHVSYLNACSCCFMTLF